MTNLPFQPDHPDQTKHLRLRNSDIEVGRFTYGHRHITCKQYGEGANLTIGAFCSIANGVVVMLGGNHRVDWITTYPFGHLYKDHLSDRRFKGHPQSNGDVLIGNDVWIGTNVTIMSGISIGNGAVVAANSTVVKDVGPYEIWGGNPARFIKTRFDAPVVAELQELAWWDWPVDVIVDAAEVLSGPASVEALRSLREKRAENPDVAHP